MSDLILPSQNNQVGMYDEKVFNEVAVASTKYLPRVSLMGSNSKPVVEGKATVGKYMLIKDSNSFLDMTNEFNALILAWRPLAMRLDGDNIITEFDPQSEVFKKIMADSETPDSGCMWGPDFLLALPNLGCATYFASSKTSRREAQNAMPILKGTRMATFRSHLISGAKFKWWGPLIGVCSVKEAFVNMPDQATIDSEFAKFINPDKSQAVEQAKATGTARER